MNVGKEISSHTTLSTNIIRTKRPRTGRTSWMRLGFLSIVLLNILLLPLNVAPTLALADAASYSPVDIWWPTDGAHLSGVQPFKAEVAGMDASSYQMYWQVDGGQLNPMNENDTDSPHQEASVDLSGWNWNGSGPYTVTFVAQKGGVTVAQSSVSVYVGQTTQTQTPSTQIQTQTSSVQTQPVASAPSTDPDPAHAAQMQALIEAVQSGADTDPVHAAQVSAYLAQNQTQVQTQATPAPAAQPATLQIENATNPGEHTAVDVAGLGVTQSGALTLTLQDASGNTIATAQMQVNGTGVSSQTQPSTAQPQTQTSATQAASNASASTFYVDPNSEAASQAAQWATSDPSDAAKMDILAAQPTAQWFGDWSGDIQPAVSTYVGAAVKANQVPVLVAYDIPQRDCGGYSAGGSDNYTTWIGGFARGIGNNKVVVILEPDALAQISCLSATDQATRYQMLSSAVSILKSNPNTQVYIDAGHSGWVDPTTMATELQKANIAHADGFSLNVSNFDATNIEATYGEQISSLVGGKHFVVDTSRNGSGSNGAWCNPSGMSIGADPTTNTGNSLIDAYLWVKTPGESDGNCNGGPAAGVWWAAYALSLVK